MKKQIDDATKQKKQLEEKCNEIETKNPEIERRLERLKREHATCDKVFQVKDVEVRQKTESLRKEKDAIEGPYNQI